MLRAPNLDGLSTFFSGLKYLPVIVVDLHQMQKMMQACKKWAPTYVTHAAKCRVCAIAITKLILATALLRLRRNRSAYLARFFLETQRLDNKQEPATVIVKVVR